MGIKKQIGLAMATTALGATLLAGGSFALFTSNTTNTGNTFTAGTVSLQSLTNGPVASQAVFFNSLAPGDNGDVKLKVKNNGNLAEWVHINTTASDASKSTGGLFGGANPLALTYESTAVLLQPGQEKEFNIHYNFPLAADNSYQGATGTFNVVVDGVQARNNTNAANNGPISWN